MLPPVLPLELPPEPPLPVPEPPIPEPDEPPVPDEPDRLPESPGSICWPDSLDFLRFLLSVVPEPDCPISDEPLPVLGLVAEEPFSPDAPPTSVWPDAA